MIDLKRKLETVPPSPGVYIFRDEGGDVIYVGKAKSLRDRVRSYFQAPVAGDVKGEALREEIADLEVTVCSSEIDALILEATFIKKYSPRYNVVLRDDKSFPYIAVTVSETYPRAVLTRARRAGGTRYYGPYVNARAAKGTLNLLLKVFPLRRCRGSEPGKAGRGGSPCLYYEMKMCAGPCAGAVSVEEYRMLVKSFCDFLEGRPQAGHERPRCKDARGSPGTWSTRRRRGYATRSNRRKGSSLTTGRLPLSSETTTW